MATSTEAVARGAPLVCVRLFDRFEVTVDGLPVADERWRLRKARDLFKLLALERGHRLHREQVMAFLWPDRDPQAVANNLHQVLHVARRALDVSGSGRGGLLPIEGQMIALAPAAVVEVDVLAFEAAAREARRVGTVAAIRAALTLFTGDLLPEDRYEDWAEERRLVIEEARRDLLRRLAQAEISAATPVASTMPPAVPSPSVANNLPSALSSFVGREVLLTDLHDALQAARLLTLTGPGGVGKTRLAVALARRCLDNYPDGAWLVDLSAVARDDAVAGAVAAVLGVRAGPGEALLDAVAASVGNNRTLLVLDTCEHVVAGSALLAERMLSMCAGLTILVTSRELLRIAGEVVWRVPSLTTPDRDATEPDAVTRSEAARLLVDRARAASPTFALTPENAAEVAHICRRLDGLPLAIELVAGRLVALGVDRLVDLLDRRLHLIAAGGRTPITRQQTLRATVEWSHDLLADAERITLRRLAVFVGGFDLEAAEVVCAGGVVVVADVLELVLRLVDKSLVDVEEVAGTIRYRVLDTIREYALEKLREADEVDATTERHATWFLGVARRVQQHLGRGDEAQWLRRLDPEQDNLRAAMDRLLATDGERALGMAAALWPFWLRRLQLVEGGRRLEEALTAAPPGHDALRAQSLLGAAALELRSGRATAARGLLAMAVEHGRAADDPRTVCWALLVLQGLGTVHRHGLEDTAQTGASRLNEAAELAAAAGLDGHRAAVDYYRGVDAYHRGDSAAMRRHFDACLELLRSIPDDGEPVPSVDTIAALTAVFDRRLGPAMLRRCEASVTRVDFDETLQSFFELPPRAAEALVCANIAVPRILGGGRRAVGTADVGAARAALREALRLAESTTDDRTVAEILSRIGNLERGAGDLRAAQAALERCLELRRRLGDVRGIGLSLVNLGSALAARDDTAAGAVRIEEGLAVFRRTGDRWGTYVALGRLAEFAARAGDAASARRLFTEAVDQLRRVEAPRWLAWGLLGLADLERADGDESSADMHVAEARGLFADVGDSEGLAGAADRISDGADTPIRR